MPAKCPACGSEMEPGYVPDRSGGWYEALKWYPGPLETGFLGGVKKSSAKGIKVIAYRCTNCGRLDLYAPQEE